MRKMVCSMLCVALCMSVARADDSPKKVIAAWEAYQKAAKESRAISSEAFKTYQEAVKDGKDRAEALKAYRKATTKSRAQTTKVLESFAAAFASSDWSGFDKEAHSQMLQLGIPAVGNKAMKEGKLTEAVKAFSSFVEMFPKSPRAPSVQLNVGDLYAAQGNVEKARKAYEAVADGDNDRYKRYAAQRLLIGKDAPEIKSDKWIGAESQNLSQLRGKVVVVDFWATWCGPCRVVMPGLSKLYREHKKDGLVVMGLTRFYANGYLPANPEQMLSGGKSVTGISEEKFVEHVTAFRDNTKMSYPFVIGEKENFSDYRVSGIPSVAVINAKGKIALLAVGANSEPMVRAVVERELKKAGK